MARLAYSVFFYLILPLILLRLCYRALKAPAYRERWAERFGVFKPPEVTGGIWVHAVSVGETIAAAPLIKALQARYPALPITVTTMTPTGSERVQAMFGDSVFHVYAPYDMPDAVNRFLDRVAPKLAIVMETEVWPNTIAACARKNIPVVLANARLSEKSARGYGKLRALIAPTFAKLDIVAQSKIEAERFRALGGQRVSVSGSIKFDIAIADELRTKAQTLRSQWQGKPILLAASTHEGEESIILDAWQATQAECPFRLILVPRHPERFPVVAALLEQRDLAFQRRSAGDQFDGDILLGDTMGEIMQLLGTADIAFVGGSLIPRGGHNMLEPAAWGLPIVTGDSDFNFAEISRLLQDAGALKKVDSAAVMAAQIKEWLDEQGSSEEGRRAGEAALQVVANNRGALEKLLDVIRQKLPT